MTILSQDNCEACKADALLIDDNEAQQLLRQLPDWSLITVESVKQLQRKIKVKNFVNAMAFANRLARIAEEQGHHPAILVEWGKVTVTWWTHSIGGLHRNDFIMAAKTDSLLLC